MKLTLMMVATVILGLFSGIVAAQENEASQLRTEVDALRALSEKQKDEIETLQAENKQLRENVERLTRALHDAGVQPDNAVEDEKVDTIEQEDVSTDTLRKQWSQAVRNLKEARDAVAPARAQCMRELSESPEYKDAVATVEKASQEMSEAQKSGDSARQQEAGVKFLAARTRLRELRNSVETLPSYRAALAKADDLTRAEAQAKARLEARVAREALDRKLAAAQEVSFKQLEVLGERYNKKLVKVSSCTFGEASNTWVDELPGVAVDSNGLVTIVDKREMEKWIGFSASDESGFFSHLFADKADYGDMLAEMNRGTKLTLLGVVVELDQAGWYGIVCTNIKAINEE